VFRHTAHIYDLIHQATGKDYGEESKQLDEQIRARNPTARHLLDVACGTGAHLRHLHGLYHVTGVDLEPAMLAEAQTHLPGVELIEADMRSLSLNRRFDAITCLFSSIGYMQSTEELNTAIGAMARHLNPGGVLIVDGWVRPDAWIDPGTTHVEVAESHSMKVVRAGRSRRVGKQTHLEMHHLVVTLDRVDHIFDEHVLTLFSDDEYRAAFGAARLEADKVASPMPRRDRYIGQAST
jgi:ubiquinone/menaquinone biosynthesis C-methylase UbiE